MVKDMPTQYLIPLLLNLLVALVSLGAFILLGPRLFSFAFMHWHPLQKKELSILISLVVSVTFGVCIVWINTIIDSRTSEINPPHGTGLGVWDENPSNEQFGGTAIFYGQECLAIGSDEWPIQKKAIDDERFIRYLLPPLSRYHCYSSSEVGCTWVDIDVQNYDIRLQWLEYLMRLGIGVLCGLIANELLQSKYGRLASNSIEKAG